jgi:hypothetical protein
MEKEFVFYKQALALKEIGFDEPCIATVDQIEYVHIKGTKSSPRGSMMYDTIDCPLYSQAFRWFREEYGLWQIIIQNTDKDWTYDIMTIIGMVDYKIFDVFDTYEEAELECLKKLIEIVKQQKEDESNIIV